ncbi:MAG: transposase [Ilumatobacter sp.]|nr:transposase [Ilumatobacter sp.]
MPAWGAPRPGWIALSGDRLGATGCAPRSARSGFRRRQGPHRHLPDGVHLLATNRQRWRATPDLVAHHRQHRPLIERSIARLTRDGRRRCRYRGVERNHLALTTRAATSNPSLQVGHQRAPRQHDRPIHHFGCRRAGSRLLGPGGSATSRGLSTARS